MAFSDRKITTYPGINDAPTAPTSTKGGNGAHLIQQHNLLCDDSQALDTAYKAKDTDLQTQITAEKAKVVTLQSEVATLKTQMAAIATTYAAIAHTHANYLTQAQADARYALIGGGTTPPPEAVTYAMADFTGTNDTSLQSYSPALGGNFTAHTGSAAISDNDLLNSATSVLIATQLLTVSDVVLRLKMGYGKVNSTHGFAFRYSNNSNHAVAGAYYDSEGLGHVWIGEVVSNVWSTLVDVPFDAVDIDATTQINLTLKAIGQNIELTVDAGTETKTINVTSSNLLTNKRHGFYLPGPNLKVIEYSAKSA